NKKTIRPSSNSLKIIIKILASVLFDKEPELMTRELSHLGEVALFYGLSLDYETYFRYIKIVALLRERAKVWKIK
ncbi:hypothetical protein, partial [Ligilactobacillus salivarius]|uniref:hypothetical protein n=1 Tax=Ligilactobacillus salivarius TaxID=1624 RepID=UPI001CDA915F